MKIGDTYYSCELSDILDELSNQLEVNGIHLLQKRKNLQTHIMVQCPYHSDGQEKRPSAGIRKEDGIFHCFACNEVHLLPEVISHCFGKYDDLLGKFGYKWLQKNFQHLQTDTRPLIKLDLSREKKQPEKKYVSESELDSYRYTHKYLYERGMTDEIIDLFDLGYDKNSHDITFPVRDITGRTLFIARRNIRYKRYEYPRGIEKPLYGLYELSLLDEPAEEVIICEGMFDALSCWVYGKYAVALNGLGTPLQLKQIRGLHARKIILATDMDKYGMRARKRIRDFVPDKIISEYIWDISDAKDINAMTKEQFLSLREIL